MQENALMQAFQLTRLLQLMASQHKGWSAQNIHNSEITVYDVMGENASTIIL